MNLKSSLRWIRLALNCKTYFMQRRKQELWGRLLKQKEKIQMPAKSSLLNKKVRNIQYLILLVNKELAFVTEALELDERGRKHWFYRLRKEYLEQEKMEKIEYYLILYSFRAQKKARKEFRRMMKEYQLPSFLDQQEDFEKFYNQEEG